MRRLTFFLSLSLAVLIFASAAETRKLTPMEKALSALNAQAGPEGTTLTASASGSTATAGVMLASFRSQVPVFIHPGQSGLAEGNSLTAAVRPTQLSDPLGLTTTATADIITLSWFNPWTDRGNSSNALSNTATANALANSATALAMMTAMTGNSAGNPAGQPAAPSITNFLHPQSTPTGTNPASNTGTAWSKFAGYLVYKNKLGDAPVLMNVTPVTETQFKDLTVTASTMYQYRVIAIDATGSTMTSSEQIMAYPLPSLPPDMVKDLEASPDDERVSLRWSKVIPTSRELAGYIVFRSDSAEQPGVQLNLTPTAKLEYNDDSGDISRKYYYRVAAVDSKGLTGSASTSMFATARPRSRSGLVLTSTAYPGLGKLGTGFTGDLQFLYYIGTLYGEDRTSGLPNSTALDPISLWLLDADLKYSLLTEATSPVAMALGGRGGILLQLANQSGSSNPNVSFSTKSEFDSVFGGYLALSKSFGQWGLHAGYMEGNLGNPIFRLSKYMNQETPSSLVYVGTDFPIMRRMNSALEVLYPLNTDPHSGQHPFLANLHVDRLLNFDVSYLHWDLGWAFLGYFNIRFTVFPNS